MNQEEFIKKLKDDHFNFLTIQEEGDISEEQLIREVF